jgi:hypothetical protein
MRIWAKNTQGGSRCRRRVHRPPCALASPREGPLTKMVWTENPNWLFPGTTAPDHSAIKISIQISGREP